MHHACGIRQSPSSTEREKKNRWVASRDEQLNRLLRSVQYQCSTEPTPQTYCALRSCFALPAWGRSSRHADSLASPPPLTDCLSSPETERDMVRMYAHKHGNNVDDRVPWGTVMSQKVTSETETQTQPESPSMADGLHYLLCDVATYSLCRR